ncbi:MAG TPA: amino acid ABC transporter ATP-binding protein, partial [Pirellulaceae bacterium]|nr:amino acid ABC transporter ATP-binding protein [Pirellulaceae bacterium]
DRGALSADERAAGLLIALSGKTPGEGITRSMSQNHVSLKNVTKRYGERTILNDISLEIASGETVALIGPSGGGKSTLLRCINGLTTFDAGQVSVGEHTLTSETNGVTASSVRRLFGMIFQDFQLFPHLTALENVMEAPVQVLKQPRSAARDRALDLLNRVGLAERAHYHPKQLSGGQKQRVAIARALAMEPRGLLCDEITSALDPELKCEVLDTLTQLKGEGLTLIVVTHEIGFARRAADRVAVLADARLIEYGSPAQVLDNPQTERTQRFLKQVLA